MAATNAKVERDAVNESKVAPKTQPSILAVRQPYRFDGYYVRLEIFEGPLELLLYLVRRNEADICDIPLSEVTQQYLEYLQLMQELNIPLAAEFIVMAATLLYLKSALLLPDPEIDDEMSDDGDTDEQLSPEEIKAALTRRLVEYSQFREAAEYLSERSEHRALMFTRADGNGVAPPTPKVVELGHVSIFDLLSALREVLERLPPEDLVQVPRRKVTMGMRIRAIMAKLRSADAGLTFAELCDDCWTRLEVIVTFLALLELIHRKLVRAEQEHPFAPITVRLVTSNPSG